MIDQIQAYLQQYIIVDRPVSTYEISLKDAIESGGVKVVKIQVRRPYKSDPRYKTFRPVWAQVHHLFLIFDFACPCGETRREVLNITTDWKKEHDHLFLKNRLKDNIYKHLKAEGRLE